MDLLTPSSRLVLAASLAVVGLCFFGCRGNEQPVEEERQPTITINDNSDPEPSLLLSRAGYTFGAAHPEGLSRLERTSFIAEFATEHDVELLLEFYRRELTGYETERGPDVVKLTHSAPTRPDIFIMRRGEGQWHITYLRTDAELDTAAVLERTHLEIDRFVDTGTTAEEPRPSYPLPPRQLAAWQEQQAAAENTPDEPDSLYEERTIIENGQEVQVLVPRPDATISNTTPTGVRQGRLTTAEDRLNRWAH